MTPSVGQAAMRLALFLIIAAGLTLPWVPRDSAEFVLSVLTIGVGLLLLLVAAILVRKGR